MLISETRMLRMHQSCRISRATAWPVEQYCGDILLFTQCCVRKSNTEIEQCCLRIRWFSSGKSCSVRNDCIYRKYLRTRASPQSCSFNHLQEKEPYLSECECIHGVFHISKYGWVFIFLYHITYNFVISCHPPFSDKTRTHHAKVQKKKKHEDRS